jgi:malto-oligosyltrehalose trehalohydrolase
MRNARRSAHAMRFGAEPGPDGVRFRLWAPKVEAVWLRLEGDGTSRPMRPAGREWHELVVAEVGAGARYRFVLPDGVAVPDPASRHQPEDVHGPSEVIDPAAYEWQDGAWRGRPWEDCVLYELHVGAFTAEGSFRAAIAKLDHLAALGVTAIELMPVADFPGRRNWGYDGVLPFAPDASYGRPEDLKALVDAAHARGLMVILDVVYNHFGPDGNYLPLYAPVLTDRHHTPWGPAVNFDADGAAVVRELVIENALYWIEEFHMDGLRLDAVHAIVDDSPVHVLGDLAARVRAQAPHAHLILENEENHASLLRRDGRGRPVEYTAQWNDDVHHALHAAATGESAGYYAEYVGDTEKLGRALAEGFAFQGEVMKYRGRGRARGEPSAGLPPTAFVSFIQNHDQVGNRAFGDRIMAVAPPEAVRALAAVYLLAPQVPMIFMGEEWGASEPFPFFCDFDGDLARSVRDGRRAEFARFPEFRDPGSRERIPDPTAEATFLSAKLNWEAAERGAHRQRLALYRRLLAVRHAEIVPRLAGMEEGTGRYHVLAEGAVRVAWTLGDGSGLTLVANLRVCPLGNVTPPPGRVLWTEGEVDISRLGAWSVAWSLREA